MDKIKLKKLMKEYGDNQTILAKALGLSRTRLNSKINERGNASFTQPEIKYIKERYNLSADDVEKIFFTV